MLALPLIAPRPDDSFSDAFRDVEGKLGLPWISKKAEFSAAITNAPATAPMPQTMTGGGGFLSEPAEIDPHEKGRVTVKQDVRVDPVLKNKLPLESWPPVAKGLPVDSTSAVGDNSVGETAYGTPPGVHILGGRPILAELNEDTVTGLHSSPSTVVATSTQTTTIMRRVIITTPKSASKLGAETTSGINDSMAASWDAR